MSDISVRVRAEALGKSIENLAAEVEAELNQAIADVANGAYAFIVSKAQQELNTTRMDYLKGLDFQNLGNNTYLIVLDGKFPNSLESGYTSFDVKTGMLESKKIVQVGPRAGQPWVQTNKEGKKFAHVPFEHRPFSKAPQVSDLAQAIRKIKVQNQEGLEQKLTKIFRDSTGRPIEGKVATVESVDGFPQLAGLTKYQKIYRNEEKGTETVQSLYMTFRTVSEDGKSWMHPGHPGIHAFEEAELWVQQEIDNIIKTLIK